MSRLNNMLMVLQLLLILAIVLQIVAAGIALKLIKATKYNIAWILFVVALVGLTFIRYYQYVDYVGNRELKLPAHLIIWMETLTSFCFAIGVFYVHKIFKRLSRLDAQRRLTEKRILNTILRTEEKERSRFSKEIHDGLGPLLSSARMSLSAVDPESLSPKDRDIIDNTSYVIGEAIRSVREISNNLSPHVLNDFGLARGVGNFINKCLSINDVTIRFSTNLRNERFDTDVEVILYRVICELINNSLKHAKCSEINLSLLYNNDIMMIDYSDNGRGFNPQAVMDVGMGLSNINSRINSLKGTTEITGSKGKGMRAHIEVDVSAGAHRDGVVESQFLAGREKS